MMYPKNNEFRKKINVIWKFSLTGILHPHKGATMNCQHAIAVKNFRLALTTCSKKLSSLDWFIVVPLTFIFDDLSVST